MNEAQLVALLGIMDYLTSFCLPEAEHHVRQLAEAFPSVFGKYDIDSLIKGGILLRTMQKDAIIE